MILRLALIEEAGACYQCIEDAREYHKSLGFEMWHPHYPTEDTIIEDIKAKRGYVFCDEEGMIGYVCIIIGDDPAYHSIDGAWATDRAYVAVRRMAFNMQSRGKHLSKEAFSLIRKFCIDNKIYAIRVDTHSENKVAQHILIRENFKYCGIIQFDGQKLAYEWDY